MSFFDIFGQERAVAYLHKCLAEKRVSHAYLFVGPEGVGKRRAALTFAQALNCRVQGVDPCGICSSCRRIWEDKYPDVKQFSPEGKSIKIARMRSLQGEVFYRPLEGRYKVYIVDEADKMTEDAANSLLRVLEEPPTDTVFLLLSSQVAHILPTIVSRCQPVPFRPLPPGLLMEKLQEERGLPMGEARVLAAAAAGSWGRAVTLAGSDVYRETRHRLQDLCTVLTRQDEAGRWQVTGEMEKGDLSLIMEQMLFWFRDILVWKETRTREMLINQEQDQCLKEMASLYSREGLLTALAAIQETIKILQENVNPRLALDVLLGRLGPDMHGR